MASRLSAAPVRIMSQFGEARIRQAQVQCNSAAIVSRQLHFKQIASCDMHGAQNKQSLDESAGREVSKDKCIANKIL